MRVANAVDFRVSVILFSLNHKADPPCLSCYKQSDEVFMLSLSTCSWLILVALTLLHLITCACYEHTLRKARSPWTRRKHQSMIMKKRLMFISVIPMDKINYISKPKVSGLYRKTTVLIPVRMQTFLSFPLSLNVIIHICRYTR